MQHKINERENNKMEREALQPQKNPTKVNGHDFI